MQQTGNIIVDGVVQIVAAHVGNNKIDSAEVPALMKSITATLVDCIRDASSVLSGDELKAFGTAAVSTRVATASAGPSETAPVAPAENRRTDLPTEPAVAIKDSIKRDGIICLFDGEKRKMLHRHIRSKYNMSPEEYRAYWNLEADYPMTAPGYALEKREVAIAQGLGTKRLTAKKTGATAKKGGAKRARQSA